MKTCSTKILRGCPGGFYFLQRTVPELVHYRSSTSLFFGLPKFKKNLTKFQPNLLFLLFNIDLFKVKLFTILILWFFDL